MASDRTGARVWLGRHQRGTDAEGWVLVRGAHLPAIYRPQYQPTIPESFICCHMSAASTECATWPPIQATHSSLVHLLSCVRSINFVRFIDGLRHVATKLRISLNKVMELVVLIGKPINAVEYD